MLQLQRASAGSGKTYTLAKKFIWYLLTRRDAEGTPRLRNVRDIADALPRILAITFTNKATAEMKQRIIDKLAALSLAAVPGALSREQLDKTDYLRDFERALRVTPAEIGSAARVALGALLNNFSYFRVSTIDTFFQTILRTFAYEANLNDNFSIQVEDEPVHRAAIDVTFEQVIHNDNPAAQFWIERLMQEGDTQNRWNLFQKSEADKSLYRRLISSLNMMSSEKYKEVRKSLEAYYATEDGHDPLARAYVAVDKKMKSKQMQVVERVNREGEAMRDLVAKAGLDAKADLHRYFGGHINKCIDLNLEHNPKSNSHGLNFKKVDFQVNSLLQKGRTTPMAEQLMTQALRMYEAHDEYEQFMTSPDFVLWQIYKPGIPFMGLLNSVRQNLEKILEQTNTIMLGETNSMLRRIISDDDTPFIYERMGSEINHYLIDEFQDTSSMQWKNLRPLVAESIGRGEDNLIIGDAKQSIYRFRNADPSLITTAVPEEFPDHVAAGHTRADNTNWRSTRNVVEFNNFLFTILAGDAAAMSTGKINFDDLYANVVQYASHRDPKGYVQVQFFDKPKDDSNDNGDAGNIPANDPVLLLLPQLVTEIKSRGYRQQDIAVLVNKNKEATEVIDAFTTHNLTAGKADKIDFISDESLLVSRAESVAIIINVLKHMTDGADRKAHKKQRAFTDWSDIKTNFTFFAIRHPELSVSQQIDKFFENEPEGDVVTELLCDMQTVALPALVEAVTENFVPVELRRDEAVFIAALQDLVLEFADNQPADVPTFLAFWETVKNKRAVTSPVDTDAVRVMTIHKSKGLEFKCVIVPFIDENFEPGTGKGESNLAQPVQRFRDMGLPPWLPIRVSKNLEDTEHHDLWDSYHDMYVMDLLNKAYVAFTRAVDELYVFGRTTPRTNSITKRIEQILTDANAHINSLDTDEARELSLAPGSIRGDLTARIFTVGQKGVNEQKEKERGAVRIVDEYGVDSSPKFLHYVEGNDDGGAAVSLADDDRDPRSEGNMLHAVMELVRVPSDIPRAVTTLRMQGLISPDLTRRWIEMLTEAVQRPEVAEWFAPGWTVLSERSIFGAGKGVKRPDRVMISRDRKRAVVVDYKFGAVPDNRKHINQVRAYCQAIHLATGIDNVTGYLWYVRQDEVVSC